MAHRTNSSVVAAAVLLACTLAALALPMGPSGVANAEDGGYQCGTPDKGGGVPPGDEPVVITPPNIRAALMRLKLYVVRDSSGAGGFTSSQVDTIVACVRADYAPSGIYFDVVTRDTLDTAMLHVPNPWPAFAYGSLSASVIAAPELSMSEGASDGGPTTRCWVALTGVEAASVLTHEIGHCLGLLHTFDRAYDCDFERPANCDTCGDMVCDTPVDYYGEHMRDHVDQGTCELVPEEPELMQPPPLPDITNYMSYTWPTCMDHFTEGQTERMLYFIENSQLLIGSARFPLVSYENKSGDTNLDYDGTPYSSAVLDYNADGKKDLFVAMRDNQGSLQKQDYLSQAQVPQFTDRTDYDFASGQTPQTGLRGVAAADYDNDGRVDLFAAAESSPRLYHNNNGSFADSASALGLASLADSSYAGAWGDFDRDGQIDLYVCRGAGGGSDPTAVNLGAARGRLLRNDVRASGTFVDRSDSLGASVNRVGAAVAAAWADVEGDGDLDLFVGDLRDASGSASSRFYLNNGAGSMSESFASKFSGLLIENVNSVAWADMNNDANLDLVLGSEGDPPAVYVNDGSGNFGSDEPLLTDLEAPTNGVRPVDADLDGTFDIIALPRATDDRRWLFWNQVVGGQRLLLDQSHFSGLADTTGRVDGVAVADFNGDGDADFYFGRSVDTEDYFFRAVSTGGDEPTADWVGVRLVAGGGNNGSAIGATVRFYITQQNTLTYQQVQVVDGGSGKGGQADNVLVCGLGEMTGTVSAEVKWPGGFVQTTSLTRGQVTNIADETVPGTPSSVSGVYVALPEGQAEFRFTWDTAYSCKPSLDKVTVSDRPRQPEQCEMGTRVLTPSGDNVTHSVFAKAGGGYRHTLTWPLECRAPCTYNFTIESATDSTHRSQMAQSAQISMPVCISQ